MKDLILKSVKHFLETHQREKAPLLLGFSGGADSLALLYLLLECRRFFPLTLHLAHIDHGWREESAHQAAQLQMQAQKLGLSFHLHTLKEPTTEEEARQERLAFFLKLYRELGCQALLLAHHADDQAETVLKRFLEGARLLSLGGMKSCFQLNGMNVWRPLLRIEKRELLLWLGKNNLNPIEDPSNADPKFLRSRMRVQIFPELERAFGKKIASNLVRFSETIHELDAYLYKKNPLFSIQIERAASKVSFDFTPHYPLDPLEIKLFLMDFSKKEGIEISHKTLNKLQEFIKIKASNKKVDNFLINNGVVCLIKN
jgi:tRNA(Ile)-lysidine synthase